MGDVVVERNYYDILQVSTKASNKEIERQFNNLGKKYFQKIDVDAKDMLDLSMAYRTLINEELKKEYLSQLSPVEVIIINFKYGVSISEFNYYELLNVSNKATQEEITRKFLSTVDSLFPLLNENKIIDELMNDIMIAYRILSDKNTRMKYDRELQQKAKNELSNFVLEK